MLGLLHSPSFESEDAIGDAAEGEGIIRNNGATTSSYSGLLERILLSRRQFRLEKNGTNKKLCVCNSAMLCV